MVSTEKFVDFVTDERGVLRRLVVDLKTGKQSLRPTDTKRKFIDIVGGQKIFYNPVSGNTEYDSVGKVY